MKRKTKNGFTLVELLAVIVILAIILVIAVPKVMSVIEDSKKATLESTAKMIASAAEKQKVQNTVLGKGDAITCDSVAKINDLDYASCSITFDDNTAKVTIEGKGKFKGLNVCSGTKTNAEATNDSCIMKNGCFAYKVVQKVESFDINKEKCKEMFYDFGTVEQQEMFCSGGIDSISGFTLKDLVNYGEIPLNELILGEVVSNIKYLDKVVAITGYDISCGTDVVIPNKINNVTVTTIGRSAFTRDGEKVTRLFLNKDYTISNLENNNNDIEITPIDLPGGIGITSVILPNTITTIGDAAFYANVIRGELDLTNTKVETIGANAFSDNEITSVKIPNTIVSIGRKAFRMRRNGYNYLTNVYLGNVNAELGNCAFGGVDSIEHNLPNSYVCEE